LIISYELGNSLYINLTNRCSNACEFCLRNGEKDLGAEHWNTDGDLSGASALWLEREPDVDEIIADLRTRELSKYDEVVFCGFGEPFTRFDDCAAVANRLKRCGVKIRVNTNGQANLIHGRDVTGEMVGLFDVVSISLNGKNAEEYQRVCHSDYGEAAYDALLDFGQKCAEKGMKTVFTVVDLMSEEDIKLCGEIAAAHGGTLRVRKYIE
jgi:TatD family-associated radical SAM protein